MGGLVVRAYVRVHGHQRIARVITLGTPHHGTNLARFGIGSNARQMRCQGQGSGSDWLTSLAANESAAQRALLTSIFSHHDNIVAPQTSCRLPGAKNIEFGGVGHVAMGRDRRILQCVLDEIRLVPRTGAAAVAVAAATPGVARVLPSIGVPTQPDIDDLTRRIAQLSHLVAQLFKPLIQAVAALKRKRASAKRAANARFATAASKAVATKQRRK